MEELPDELEALVNHVESAIDEINSAVIAANHLELAEIAPWLEWLGEELGDLLFNLLRTPSQTETRSPGRDT
jgi:hypothetical protein